MPEGFCFRTHFGSQRINGSQTLLKFARQLFYPNFLLIWDELKNISLSQIWNVRTISLTRWQAFLSELREILVTSSNAIIFKTINIFRNFFQIFAIYITFCDLEKKNHLYSLIISEVIDCNECLTWMYESLCFRTPFGTQPAIGSQTLLEPEREHFYTKLLLISDNLSWKTSLLIISEILGLSFNTLTTYHMYCLQNWEKFMQQVKMQLSSKPLTFFQIVIPFLKST